MLKPNPIIFPRRNKIPPIIASIPHPSKIKPLMRYEQCELLAKEGEVFPNNDKVIKPKMPNTNPNIISYTTINEIPTGGDIIPVVLLAEYENA